MTTGERPTGSGRGCAVVAVLVIIIVFLSCIAFLDPSANMPVISPVVCSLKGATWYDGGILGAPGCYESAAP